MSVAALEIAFRTETASPVHKLVLVALADGTPLEGVAARCGLDADQAAEVIQSLHDAGHVTMTAQGVYIRDRRGWLAANGERFPEASCRSGP